MWLLGAGASASAGVPTAWDMIWDFKQRLFVSQRRASPQSVADLSSSGIRAELQAHVDALGSLPASGDPDEYAALFEVVYPAEADRRTYLDAKLGGARPSYGHLALATLMRGGKARVIWTTNFDSLVADACAKVYDSTGNLTTVTLDAPALGEQCFREERWPLEVKLHGDFRSRRLKNTGDELLHQDQRLRRLFAESCHRFGLVVCGYSGRDGSIMQSLEAVTDGPDPAFPAGLFWLHRGSDPPLPRVAQFLVRARAAGVDAALVPVESFDETMRDLVRMTDGLDTAVIEAFGGERQRWGPAPRPVGRRGWPVVRLNALPVTEMPTVCRRVVCEIGGYREVRAAVVAAGVDVIVARVRLGVLAFGADGDVRAAFGKSGITDFDLHTIDRKRLRHESGERGLLHDALTRALSRTKHLDVFAGRISRLAPARPEGEVWRPLRKLVGSLHGAVPGHPDLTWREGVGARLDWADGRLWLLIEPRTVFDGITDENKGAATAFARERTVKRYNRVLNDLIGFWSDRLAGEDGRMHALGIGDGVDAVFEVSSATGFSRRAGA
jgi:hypothetical protein